MDRPIALLLFAAAAFTPFARAELLLTPTVVEGVGDGVKFKQLAFSDGDKTVTYRPPRGWEYSGSANQLTFHPPAKAQAEATITKMPLVPPSALDDENLKKIIEDQVAQLSKQAQNVSIVSQEKNPVMIDRKETFLLVLVYDQYGRRYNRSILFLNRDHDQIRFQLTCLEVDFKDLQKAFFASQFSWENL